jgi:hypothetical protein
VQEKLAVGADGGKTLGSNIRERMDSAGVA